VHFATHALGLVLSDDLRDPAGSSEYLPLQTRAIAAVARAAFPKDKSIYGNYVEVLEAYKLGPRPADIDRVLGDSDWRGYAVAPPQKRRRWRLW
jgi:hypothetical protein